MLRLHFNENPYGVDDDIWQEALRRLQEVQMQWYPDREASGLRTALARYSGLPGERIVMANGSDDILHMLLVAHLGEIQRVIIPTPTFGMYRKTAQVLGIEVIEVPLDAEFGLDVGRIIKQLRKAPSAVFICFPNNPTANYFRRESVEKIRKAGARLVIIDEAYYEFGGRTYAEATRDDPQVAVVRTLSKAFGVAGLRVGYVLGHEELAGRLQDSRQPFNLNSAGQILAQTVVEHAEKQLETVRLLRQQRERMREQLAGIRGLTPLPSVTNFFLVEVDAAEFGMCAEEVQAELKDRGIWIRYLAGLPGYVRVSAGLPQHTDRLIDAIEDIRA